MQKDTNYNLTTVYIAILFFGFGAFVSWTAGWIFLLAAMVGPVMRYEETWVDDPRYR